MHLCQRCHLRLRKFQTDRHILLSASLRNVSLWPRLNRQFGFESDSVDSMEDLIALSSLCSGVPDVCPPSGTTGGRIYCKRKHKTLWYKCGAPKSGHSERCVCQRVAVQKHQTTRVIIAGNADGTYNCTLCVSTHMTTDIKAFLTHFCLTSNSRPRARSLQEVANTSESAQ